MACRTCGASLAAGCQCSLSDSTSIDVTGSGLPTDPFIPALIVDPDADNLLTVSAAGALVQWETVLGFSGNITVVQSGIDSSADIAGSSTPVVLPSNHWIEVKFYCPGFHSTGASESWSIQIKDGSSVIQERFFDMVAVAPRAFGGGETVRLLENPSAGAHTYKATLARSTGTGAGSTVVSTTAPAYLVVKDLGPT